MRILLNNLPQEDLVHILDAKIPAFLRIDRDIKNKRDNLQYFYKQYQDFDIEILNKEIRKKLLQNIEQASADFK